MNKKGLLAIKPIKLSSMEYKGTEGENALNIDYSLSKLITQNILYAAYHEPISIAEIAKLLSIPKNVVEEDIDFLEKNGFMINTSSDIYLTNMLLHDYSPETQEKLHSLYTKAATDVCDKYIPSLIDVATQLSSSITTNETIKNINDFNVFLWSLTTFACSRKYILPNIDNQLEKYYAKRKDESHNLAYATVIKDHHYAHDYELYRCYGDTDFTIAPDIFPFRIWLFNTIYSSRADGKIACAFAGFPDLYDFIHNQIENDPDKEERMERIVKNGLVVNDAVNTIVIKKSLKDFADLLPAMPDELAEVNHELDAQVYKLCKSQYPPHLQNLFRVFCKNTLNSGGVKTRILEQLLKKEILKPLTENQKKTVNMMMFLEI